MEEVVHDPAVSNTSIAVISGAVTAIGMAMLGVMAYALNLYFKWKKGNLEIRDIADAHALKNQQGTTDLKIHVMDGQIDRWKVFAERETTRADAAEKRAADERKACDEKMLDIVQRYRAREDLMTKQHQEREHMFNEIATQMRAENDAKVDAISIQHRECIEESANLKGRMMEIEKRDIERERAIKELEARLGRLDMREVSGRKPRSKPEIDINKE